MVPEDLGAVLCGGLRLIKVTSMRHPAIYTLGCGLNDATRMGDA